MTGASSVALLSATFTGTGLAFGLYRYRIDCQREARTRQRERAVTAAEQTREFLVDPDVRFTMELLDCGLCRSPPSC